MFMAILFEAPIWAGDLDFLWLGILAREFWFCISNHIARVHLSDQRYTWCNYETCGYQLKMNYEFIRKLFEKWYMVSDWTENLDTTNYDMNWNRKNGCRCDPVTEICLSSLT